ncbi:B3 domain-containing transcription factor LEC2 [Ricinus communis]|uniref:Leafy cotyledon 2 n=1 Tax=Ricinus communis TaxID=3988 RepID=V9P4F9_RICCO|nr:B3 domain-containing transcription factor LEC2 [Ricinus communis]AGT56425.1 leafy cotyledon 2 [Ricinus communis]|eukprot:NP_001310615.1 B3 domain-containing transcription factor LEC2 [Ricinus communis]
MDSFQNSQFSSIRRPLCYSSTSSNSSTQTYHCPAEDNMPTTPFQSPHFQQEYRPEQAGQNSTSAFSMCPYWLSQNGTEIQTWLLQQNGLSIDQGKKVLDAYKTKIARNKRKLARQRSLSRNSSSSANSIQVDTRRLAFNMQDSQSTSKRDLYKFCTPDNKKLRVLLRKDLKTSDVGSLGRIVLPKREAEENLPILSDKEGILVAIRDVCSTKEWSLKYKYWSNNKSRMYVLENTGDFVKQNGMRIGDSLTLYEDESKKLYFSVKKVEALEAEPSCKQHATNQNYIYIPHTYQARDEEEASLALLIEQLKHKEQQEEVNSLVTLSMDIAPYRHKEEEKNYGPFNNLTSISIYPQSTAAAMAIQPSSSAHSTMRVVDDHYIDDFYTALDVLPDVNRYNFSL